MTKYSLVIHYKNHQTKIAMPTEDMNKIRELAIDSFFEARMNSIDYMTVIENTKPIKIKGIIDIDQVMNGKTRFYWESTRGRREINRNGTLRNPKSR